MPKSMVGKLLLKLSIRESGTHKSLVVGSNPIAASLFYPYLFTFSSYIYYIIGLRKLMPIHEEPAEYTPWFKLLFLIPVGLLIGAFVLALNQESEASLVLFGEGVFFILLFHCIMPRKYQIYHDKLKIVLGSPFAISIPLSTIREVKHGSGIKALIYYGVRFVTSTKYVIEIVRNKGLNYVISPQNGDIFRGHLIKAIKNEASNRILG